MSKGRRKANTHQKEFRKSCWAHGEERKQARRETQAAAYAANRDADTTPWQRAKAARKAKRATTARTA